MNINLKKIEVSSRYILENLFTYYIYDMSQYMGWDPNSDGQYTFIPSTLDSYWLDRNYVAYFIYVDDALAGFALIRPYPTRPDRLDVEQFFVLRKYKGQGIGKKAFEEILNIHPGKWQIRVLKENEPALAFWKSVVNHRVGENFEVCIDIDIDLEMHFIRFDTE